MPFRIITIPFDTNKGIFSEEELNKFCLNKKILSYKTEFFRNNDNACWTVFLEYETPFEKTNNTGDLNEAEKLLYQRLREWRRKKAEEQGVPVFIIATNSILKNITIRKPISLEALKDIRGFGVKKVEKYGKEILDITKAFSRKP